MMTKAIAFILFSFYFLHAPAQEGFLILKKGRKNDQYFWKDSRITMQLNTRQWISGVITRITPDSLFLKQQIVRRYALGSDTLYIPGLQFSLDDIYAMPTKNQMTVYEDDQVKVIPGHEKFVWIRNGFLFQVAGAGYTALNVINHLAQNDPVFAKDNLLGLGIGAGLFLLGEILRFTFHPYLRIGRKYHFEYIDLSNRK